MVPPAGFCCRQSRSPNRSGISAFGKHGWSGTIWEHFTTYQSEKLWVKACVWVDGFPSFRSRANGCLSCMLSTSNCRASRMPPIGVQSGRNPATQFRIQFWILTVFGGFARTVAPSEIGSKIGFRNRIQNWIRPFRFWGATSDAKLDTKWGILGLCIVGCTTWHPAGPGRHLFKNYYYYSVLPTTWFSGALGCLSMLPLIIWVFAVGIARWPYIVN